MALAYRWLSAVRGTEVVHQRGVAYVAPVADLAEAWAPEDADRRIGELPRRLALLSWPITEEALLALNDEVGLMVAADDGLEVVRTDEAAEHDSDEADRLATVSADRWRLA